jgi:hypothetical protein
MQLAYSALKDRSSMKVAEYLYHHIDEERGHDDWLLEDIERLGYPKLAATYAFPMKSVASLVGTQLYIIRNLNPIGLLGYIYVLEANPPKFRFLEELSNTSGIPLSAMSTFVEHADVDQTHREDLISLLDSDAIDENDKEIIEYSAVLTAQYLCELFEELYLRCDDQQHVIESRERISDICKQHE